MTAKIKTLIKFYEGLNGKDGRMYGFVTKEKGQWKGCRADVDRKKIVLLDMGIKGIIPNQLYRCVLMPMHNNNGFVAVSAEPFRFKANLVARTRKGSYELKVKFGNMCYTYIPASDNPEQSDIQLIAKKIRKRHDLKDNQTVAEDFINSACMLKRMYDKDNERRNALPNR